MEGQQKQSGHAQGAGDDEKAKAEVEDFDAFYEKVSSKLGIRMPNNYDLAKAAIEEGKLEILKDCCRLRMHTDDLFEHLLIDAVKSGSLEMVKCVVEEQVRAIDRRAPLLGGRKWTQAERARFLDGELPITLARLDTSMYGTNNVILKDTRLILLWSLDTTISWTTSMKSRRNVTATEDGVRVSSLVLGTTKYRKPNDLSIGPVMKRRIGFGRRLSMVMFGGFNGSWIMVTASYLPRGRFQFAIVQLNTFPNA